MKAALQSEALRAPDARLIWYTAMGSHSDPAIAGLRVQAWAGQVRDIRREAAAVRAARGDKKTHPDPALLTETRARYDEQVAGGITTGRLRHWHERWTVSQVDARPIEKQLGDKRADGVAGRGARRRPGARR
jgi:hypothetical protein